MKVRCPDCRSRFRVRDEKRYRRVKCTRCDYGFTVEDADVIEEHPYLSGVLDEAHEEVRRKPRRKLSEKQIFAAFVFIALMVLFVVTFTIFLFIT
jgi:predicted Zn finger-like uncharacterized protein